MTYEKPETIWFKYDLFKAEGTPDPEIIWFKYDLFKAEGTPDPEIIWFKYDDPIQESNTVAVINDGIELRINYIRYNYIVLYLRNNQCQFSCYEWELYS